MTHFLGEFEHDPAFVAIWAEFTDALAKVRARITSDEATKIDETAFYIAVVVSSVVANHTYTALARTLFPAALDAEKESPSA